MGVDGGRVIVIVDDYGGAGTETYSRVKEPCASSDRECFEHVKEDLVDYLTNMLIRDIEEEKE